MTWIPALKPGLMALSKAQEVPPGRLLYFRRGVNTFTYLTFGQDGQTSHWLSLDDETRFQVFDPRQTRQSNVLTVELRDRLYIQPRIGPPDANQMADTTGCLGLTTLGPIICGRERHEYHGHMPCYLSLTTWRHMPPGQGGDALQHVVWFSLWDLLLEDEQTQERHKIVGSPDWNANG